MADINLKDFDKNNWDEFVHKRVLDSVIQQENATNKEQDDNIATNKADIATNKQGIADNKTAIDANKADIATNKQGIADNKSAIDANKADIATNKQGIADNKSAIESIKQEADDAKTTAENAATIAGAAQNTATQLGSQISQLDSEVLKKTSNESYFGTNSITEINGNTISSSQNGAYNNAYIALSDGGVGELLQLSVSADYTESLTTADAIQFVFSKALPALSWQTATISIADSSNNVSFTGGAKLQGDAGVRMNFDTHQSDINKLTAPYHITLDINIFNKI